MHIKIGLEWGLLLLSLLQVTGELFNNILKTGELSDSSLDQASGIAASRKFPGVLYAHNDHGDHPRIFAVEANSAIVMAEFQINPATNVDWEDIAVGPCDPETPGNNRSCIYILDDGPVSGPEAQTVYKVPEPQTISDQVLHPEAVLKFNWMEPGSEVLMVDPNGELFIIGYVAGGRGMIVHLPNSAWNHPIPVWVGSTSYLAIYTGTKHDPLGGDISPDGREVVIRTHHDIFYWHVPNGDYITALETSSGTRVIPHSDHDEATPGGICWSYDGVVFYTLGEAKHARLYMYMRS